MNNNKLFNKMDIPLVDKWIPLPEDQIFKTVKGVLVLPVSQFFGIENNSLDQFILTSKRCYNNKKMLNHLPKYMNYFEKFFDIDKELLVNIYRIKYLIDYEPSYNEDSFLNDIRIYFMSESIIRKS